VKEFDRIEKGRAVVGYGCRGQISLVLQKREGKKHYTVYQDSGNSPEQSMTIVYTWFTARNI